MKETIQDMQSAFDAVGKNTRPVNVGGRPKKAVSPTTVYRLAKLGLTIGEIAGFFGVSLATMNRRLKEPEFRYAYTKGKSNVQISVRRSQYKLAMTGNVRMQIWLGKQYLGQKDNPTPKPLDDELPNMEGPRMIHVPWTEDLEREWNAIDAEFPEIPTDV